MSSDRIYDPAEIAEVYDAAAKDRKFLKSYKKIEYLNIPAAFDIEATSFTRPIEGSEEPEKAACMYCWTLGINGLVIFGRTWEQFDACCEYLTEKLGLCNERRMIIYVHNLSYDFQFFRHRFGWKNVFSMDIRKPLYGVTDTGIEFRCSYLLSGYGLAKLGDQLHKYPVHKLVGDLDYNLLRHSGTPMTDKEIGYCVNDVKVVMAYIQERIEIDGGIFRIPLTKTGYVRQHCRKKCLYEGSHRHNTAKYLRYSNLIHSMNIDPEEYEQLKRAFAGGFTHASAWKSGKVYEHVRSYDFTSSYPAVMIAEKFPMSSAEYIQIRSTEQFIHNIKHYCCLFDVEIDGLEAITYIDHPLSASKCSRLVKPLEDNGRLVSADHLMTTWTEQDYIVMRKFYRWQRIKVGNFRRYVRGYLPTDFVAAILELYQKKTTLKNVAGKEEEYLSSKENVNAAYGMTVTDIARAEVIYTDDWQGIKPPDIVKLIAKYNRAKQRFLFYPWGVWVTAYARRNLFTGIYEFGSDYIYSDTDSIKAINADRHQTYITEYNERIIRKLDAAMQYHGFDPAAYRPCTIEGVEKILGVWDDEGEYSRFKTLGAKRYITEKDGRISITVSGVNKKKAVPYLISTFDDPFDAFTEGLCIPPEYTGKNTHTYIDYPQDGILIDYTGLAGEYHELSSVHMEAADYHLSLSAAYTDYLAGITQGEK